MGPAAGVSFITIIGLIVLLIVGAAGVFFLVVLVRGGREPGAPRPRAQTVGCALFAILAVIAGAVLLRGCGAMANRPPLRTLLVLGPGEIFVGDEPRGRMPTILGPHKGESFPVGTSLEEIFAQLDDGKGITTFEPAGTAETWVDGTRHELLLFEGKSVDRTAAVRDSFILAVIRSIPGDPATAEELPTLGYILRAKNGEARRISVGGTVFAGELSPSSAIERFFGQRRVIDCQLEFLLDEGPAEPPHEYVVDRLVEAAKVAVPTGEEEGR